MGARLPDPPGSCTRPDDSELGGERSLRSSDKSSERAQHVYSLAVLPLMSFQAVYVAGIDEQLCRIWRAQSRRNNQTHSMHARPRYICQFSLQCTDVFVSSNYAEWHDVPARDHDARRHTHLEVVRICLVFTHIRYGVLCCRSQVDGSFWMHAGSGCTAFGRCADAIVNKASVCS